MQAIKQLKSSTRKNRKSRIFTKEENLQKQKEYEQHKSNYYKGQICTFYLRGLCWMDHKCQFAHGIDDLNFENFMKFSQDRKNKKPINSDHVKNLQRSYLITNRSYKILYDFQENNKHILNFPHLLTFEQINEDLRKRAELRKIFHYYEFEKFCDLVFKNFPVLSIEEFEMMIDNLGFEYNYRRFCQKKLLSKSIIDKEKPNSITNYNVNDSYTKRTIIKLMPSEEEILKNFVEIIIARFKEDLERNEEIFPISFKYVNNMINKFSNFETPLVHHFLKMKNITANEFLEDLIQYKMFRERLKEILEEFDKELPKDEEIIHRLDINEVISEIKETFWEKFKNSDDSGNIYGFLKFDFIKENYFNNILDNKNSFVQSDSNLIFTVKKNLTHSKNLLLMNNNGTQYIFNPLQFTKSDLSEYYETRYEQRCNCEDQEIQREVYRMFALDRNDVSEFEKSKYEKDELNAKFQLDYNVVEPLTISSHDIALIDDLNSVIFFFKICQDFKEISVDLEGKLAGIDPEINLIQICDNRNIEDPNLHSLYVIDVHKIFKLDQNPQAINMLRISLTFLLESNYILKIFHDGRNDSAALHKYFNICLSNYVDTSCLYAAVRQIEFQTVFYSKFFKKSKLTVTADDIKDEDFYLLYSNVNNSINPGLNKVLENFESSKNINHLKEKMQQLFGSEKSQEEYFLKRPIDQDFLLYSALDVKYLHNSFSNMKKEIEKLLKAFYGHNFDNKMMEIIIRLISTEHAKMSCCK